MVALSEHQRVRDIRNFFQHASERNFVRSVEQITGRTYAPSSAAPTPSTVSSEVFYLHPQITPANGA